MGEVTGTPRSHDERESRLEAISITTVAFGTSHTSHFNRPGRGKRQQKPTQSSLPPTSRHNLRRITSCLNGSAPRRGRRCQGDNGNDASPSAIPSTSPITTAVRGERRGECHRLFNSPKVRIVFRQYTHQFSFVCFGFLDALLAALLGGTLW